MKQKRFEAEFTEGKNCKEITIAKRVSPFFTGVLVAVLAVGVVGVYALVGSNDIPKNDEEPTSTTTSATTTTQSENQTQTASQTTSQAVETWKKAGIEEYDLVLETVKATEVTTTTTSKTESETTKKTTTKEETTTTKKATTTTEAVTKAAATTTKASTEAAEEAKEAEEETVKSCDEKTVYTSTKVNFREAPSLDGELIKVLAADEELTVTGYTDNWYEVEYDDEVGYCMKKYTTTEAPETEEEEADEEEEETTTTGVISYTSEEFDMLCYVLQGEVGDCSESSKIAVANVIINRVKSSSFPNTIEGVLTQANQFTAIYGYYNGTNVPTQSTIDCASRALAGEDNTNGAVYYYAPKYCSSSSASWFESLTFCMEIDGQRFFK